MAASDVLKEFLVSIGVDFKGCDRAQQTMAAIGATVTALHHTMQQAAAQVKTLGAQFDQTGGGPGHRFEQSLDRAEKRSAEFARTIKSFGETAVAATAAFTAGLIEVGRRFESVYYATQKTGASVEGLAAMQFGFQQIGESADAANGIINNLVMAARQSPAAGMFLRQMTGMGVQDFLKNGVEGVHRLGQALLAIEKHSGPWVANWYGHMLGLSDEMILTLTRMGPLLYENAKRQEAAAKAAGVNLTDLTERSAKAERILGDIGEALYGKTGIFGQALNALLPAGQGIDDLRAKIDRTIDSIAAFNKTHPFAPIAEGLGTAVGAWGIFTTAMRLTLPGLAGNVGLLSSLFGMAGIAGAVGLAAYEIYENWDRIGPYLQQKFDEISKAWQEHGFEGAVKALWESLKRDIDTTDWKGLGESIVKQFSDGFSDFDKYTGQIADALSKVLSGIAKGIGEKFFDSFITEFLNDLPEWMANWVTANDPETRKKLDQMRGIPPAVPEQGAPTAPQQPGARAPLPPPLPPGGPDEVIPNGPPIVRPFAPTAYRPGEGMPTPGRNIPDAMQAAVMVLLRMWDGLQSWLNGSATYHPYVSLFGQPEMPAETPGAILAAYHPQEGAGAGGAGAGGGTGAPQAAPRAPGGGGMPGAPVPGAVPSAPLGPQAGPTFQPQMPADIYAAISQAEGTFKGGQIDYNAVLGNGRFGRPEKPLTEMTLAEVLKFGQQLGAASGRLNSSAVGAFQIQARSTMLDAARALHLGMQTHFTPEVQRMMAAWVARTQGFHAWQGFNAHPDLLSRAQRLYRERPQASGGTDFPAQLHSQTVYAGPQMPPDLAAQINTPQGVSRTVPPGMNDRAAAIIPGGKPITPVTWPPAAAPPTAAPAATPAVHLQSAMRSASDAITSAGRRLVAMVSDNLPGAADRMRDYAPMLSKAVAGIRPMAAAAVRLEGLDRLASASAQLDRLSSTGLGGTSISNVTNHGDRNVNLTMNSTNHLYGAGNVSEQIDRLGLVHERAAGDALRNFATAVV